MLETYLSFLKLGYYEVQFALEGLADEKVWQRPADGLLSIGELAGYTIHRTVQEKSRVGCSTLCNTGKFVPQAASASPRTMSCGRRNKETSACPSASRYVAPPRTRSADKPSVAPPLHEIAVAS
jgi:hypothetical protein